MRALGKQQFAAFTDNAVKPVLSTTNLPIRKSLGHLAGTYYDLAKKIAALQFQNRQHVLLFRGQTTDFKNNARSSALRPSIFRGGTKNPTKSEMRSRFARLADCEAQLVEIFNDRKLEGATHVRQHRIIRWSILQHYEVCATPLLDVTQSLRVAASFATEEIGKIGYLYVIAVPSIGGAVTVSADASMQVVRLSSACPPSAMRPHVQEGYLLGEYPDIADSDQFSHYLHREMDFGRRLIGKFRVDSAKLWKPAFPRIDNTALYPSSARDPIQEALAEIV